MISNCGFIKHSSWFMFILEFRYKYSRILGVVARSLRVWYNGCYVLYKKFKLRKNERVLFDRFKWRSCVINRTRQKHLNAFHARSVLFSSILLRISTHHFTVSNETIITSCVSQVVFWWWSLTLYPLALPNPFAQNSSDFILSFF